MHASLVKTCAMMGTHVLQASWKRWGAQQAPSRAPQQDATSLGVRNAVGLAGQPVLPSNGSFRDKRMRSSVRLHMKVG